MEEDCVVCGDRPTSFSYGCYVCSGCKSFFRYSLTGYRYFQYQCISGENCEITMNTRGCCRFCRYKKCIRKGMSGGKRAETSIICRLRKDRHLSRLPFFSSVIRKSTGLFELLRPASYEEELPSLLHTSTNALQTLTSYQSHYVPEISTMLQFMSTEDQDEIYCLVNKYHRAYKRIPYRVHAQGEQRNPSEVIEMFTTILQRFVYFTKLVDDFVSLSESCQSLLLRASILEMCLLRGAICFDAECNKWPKSNQQILADCPQVKIEDVQRIMSSGLFLKHIKFLFEIQMLKIDEPISMILIIITLFSPEHASHLERPRVAEIQDKYLLLLQKYVNWKYGMDGTLMYARILTKLKYLRELVDFHDDQHFNLQQGDMDSIRKAFATLNIATSTNPSAKFNAGATEFIRSSSSNVFPQVTTAMIKTFTDHRISAILNRPECHDRMNSQMERSADSFVCMTGYTFPRDGKEQAHSSPSTTLPASTGTHSFSHNDDISSAMQTSLMPAVTAIEFTQPSFLYNMQASSSPEIHHGFHQSVSPFSSGFLTGIRETLIPYSEGRRLEMQTTSFGVSLTPRVSHSWSAHTISSTSIPSFPIPEQGTEHQHASGPKDSEDVDSKKDLSPN